LAGPGVVFARKAPAVEKTDRIIGKKSSLGGEDALTAGQ